MFHRLRRPLSTLGAAAGAAALGATLQKSRQAESESDPLNPYKVGATLGQGAFAIVKLVTSKLTGEEFALKLVDKRWTKASAMEQELAVLRAVGRHRNVVGMVDSFEMKDVYGLVLELATGGEVFDRLCDRGTYTERDAAALVRQVASALQHIHRADVVHRDIKPENLLFVDASNPSPNPNASPSPNPSPDPNPNQARGRLGGGAGEGVRLRAVSLLRRRPPQDQGHGRHHGLHGARDAQGAGQ